MKDALRKFVTRAYVEENLVPNLISFGDYISSKWKWDVNEWEEAVTFSHQCAYWKSIQDNITLRVNISQGWTCSKDPRRIMLRRSESKKEMYSLCINITEYNNASDYKPHSIIKLPYSGYHELHNLHDLEQAKNTLNGLENFLINGK
jgi:hypothetical protein